MLGLDGRWLPDTEMAPPDPAKPDQAPATARMFYVAYFKKDAGPESRPVMFLYNGGPGSSTMWQHMGSFGPRRVVTPHLGEMARLTGRSAESLEAGRIDAPREWATRWSAVVLLKGAPTVIAAADGRTQVNTTGNPGMATAGMGDVLTGVIAGLAAQKLPLPEAARYGVCLHGAAGDLAAARGERGMLASDLMRPLRELVNRPPFAG
jgi:hypothetical protein